MNTYTASEAARLLGVSEATIRKRIKLGSLSAVKDGGTWRIPVEVVEPCRTASNLSEPQASNPIEPASNWEVESLRVKHAALERENETLRARVEHLESHVDRLMLLLANEQARRLKILPRPLSWVARLFGRRDD